ncbi:MAG: tetratricopeptide repeat protein [SAR324 cluster bacterium]|nr:tetratricopeptide repeat protein [SAR324 cluster bacterium]
MLRAYYITVILLFISGVFVSWLILPADSELALVMLKDKNFANALEVYEKKLAEGDWSQDVVKPLTDLYLQYGELEKAIRVLEKFIEKNPQNVDARYRIGTFYQYTQRPDDYRRNLEIIYKLAPTANVIRELADIYNFQGWYPKQAILLHELITRYPPPAKDDTMKLVYLYAVQHKFREALGPIEILLTLHTSKLDAKEMEFLVSVLIDADKRQEAFDYAWKFVMPDHLDEAVRLSKRLQAKGEAPNALKLIEPFESVADDHLHLLVQLVSLQLSLGQVDKALARLTRLFNADKLKDPDLLEELIKIVLERKDAGLLKQIVERSSMLDQIESETMLDMATFLAETKSLGVAKIFLGKLNQEYLEERLVVDAVLSTVAQAPNAQEKTDRLYNNNDISDRQRLTLAKFYQSAGHSQVAQKLASEITSFDHLVLISLTDVAEIFRRLGLGKVGLKLLQDMRAKRGESNSSQGDELDQAWATLSLAMGQTSQIHIWLNEPRERSQTLLTDVYFAAIEHKRYLVALEISRRLYEKFPGQETRNYLVDALLANKMYEEVLPHLRELVANNPKKWTYSYTDVLEKLNYTDELLTFWRKRLQTPNLSKNDRREIAFVFMKYNQIQDAEAIFILLAYNGGPQNRDLDQVLYIWGPAHTPEQQQWIKEQIEQADNNQKVEWIEKLIAGGLINQYTHVFNEMVAQDPQVLTLLRKKAHKESSGWVYSYYKLLEQTGHPDEIVALWKDQATRTDLNENDQRNVAFLLIQYKQPVTAETMFMTLAQNKSPKHADTVQFLYLWGSSQSAQGKKWIEERIRNSKIKDQTLWIDQLIQNNHVSQFTVLFEDLAYHSPELRNSLRLHSTTKPLYWVFSYAELLTQITDKNELRKLWQIQALRQDISDTDQAGIIYALSELGAKQDVEILLMRLSSHQSPETPYPRDLLYLWGDTIPEHAVTWLKDQLESASLEYKILWLELMIRTGTIGKHPRLFETTIAERPDILLLLRHQSRYQRLDWVYSYSDFLSQLKYQEEMGVLWNYQVQRPQLTDDEKRNIAFLLINIGDKKAAEQIFLELAQQQQAQHPDVEQLFYLWAETPPDTMKAWIHQRINTSSPQQKLLWYETLIQTGLSKHFIAEFKDYLVQNEPIKPLLRTVAFVKTVAWNSNYVQLLQEMGMPEESILIQRQLMTKKQLSVEDQRSLAYLAQKTGYPKDAEIIWMKLAAGKGPKSPDLEQLIYFWGNHPEPYALNWLISQIDRASMGERAVWIEQMIQWGVIKEFLIYFSRDLQKSPKAITPYLVKQTAAHPVEWSFSLIDFLEKMDQKTAALDVWSELTSRTELPEEDQRNIAYFLLDKGRKSPAQKVLLRLSQNQKPDSQDVQQLLYLWGPRPDAEQIAWLRHRTESAPEAEKIQWFRILQNIGQTKLVFKYIEKKSTPNSVVLRDYYLSLLKDQRNKSKFKQMLAFEISNEINPVRLEQLSKMAQEHNYPAIAETAFSKIVAMNPEHQTAKTELGKIYYSRGQYDLAETYLAASVTPEAEDLNAVYTYGDLLWQKGKYREANKFFDRILQQLSENKAKPMDQQIMAAQIYHKNKQTDKAIDIYRELAEKNPDNRQLRADLANLLLSVRRYKEAQALLLKIEANKKQ